MRTRSDSAIFPRHYVLFSWTFLLSLLHLMWLKYRIFGSWAKGLSVPWFRNFNSISIASAGGNPGKVSLPRKKHFEAYCSSPFFCHCDLGKSFARDWFENCLCSSPALGYQKKSAWSRGVIRPWWIWLQSFFRLRYWICLPKFLPESPRFGSLFSNAWCVAQFGYEMQWKRLFSILASDSLMEQWTLSMGTYFMTGKWKSD